MTGPALAIMAKAPIPGLAKTRLVPELTPEQSAGLSLAFLQDTLGLAASMGVYTMFLAFTPADAEPFFRRLAPPPACLLPQDTGDLGHRMYRLFEELTERGHSPVVVIGSDLPTLQPHHLEAAIECLHERDLCLGPSLDGGYYLIGARRAYPALFEGISWSTSTVLQSTVEKAAAAGISVGLLGPCLDVDTPEDVRRLRLEIERLERTPGARVPRFTAARLGEIRPQSETA